MAREEDRTDRFNLGAYRCPISARSAVNQRWFDIGLNWFYGFNTKKTSSVLKGLETGAPAPNSNVVEALQICKRSIRLSDEAGIAQHPAILHLDIHLLEMSDMLERGMRSADPTTPSRLRSAYRFVPSGGSRRSDVLALQVGPHSSPNRARIDVPRHSKAVSSCGISNNGCLRRSRK
jgi:hypothetical protein